MTMQNNPSVNNQSATCSIEALRLPASYGVNFGVKKLLTAVPVSKPKKQQFFRSHPDPHMSFNVLLLEDKEHRDCYILHQNAAQAIPALVRPATLRVAIDRHNNVFFIPVPLPGEDGKRNLWHDSLDEAVGLSEKAWIRITANMHAGVYDVYQAEGKIPEPEWPVVSMEGLIEVAFRGKVIQDIDHPVIQSLLGRA
jgi:hypothetical protein